MNPSRPGQHRRSGIGLTSGRVRDRLADSLRDRGIRSLEILEQIRRTPRHLFIDEALERYAYNDNALPIGAGQTISQPYVVALMTQALLMEEDGRMRRPAKVLEVGCGSGYQTAILAPLVRSLFSIERIGSLLAEARPLLVELGCNNVRFRHADGMLGWPGQAPRPRRRCRRPCWTSWRRVGVSSFPWATIPARNSCASRVGKAVTCARAWRRSPSSRCYRGRADAGPDDGNGAGPACRF